MVRIVRGEESKLTSWYFRTDLSILWLLGLLLFASIIMMIGAGSAEAIRLSKPWYHFLQRATPFYLLGIFSLFFCSMLNKKWIIWLSWLMFGVGVTGLFYSLLQPGVLNGSMRWVNISSLGIRFMPADVLKPALIMLTAWFFQKMQGVYGTNIFINKEAWKFNKVSWWPYAAIFIICCGIMFRHPDVGTALLFCGVVLIMAFVAGLPLKWFWGIVITGIVVGAPLVKILYPHVSNRASQMFHVLPRTQVWYSLNAIRHGGLTGKLEEAYVQNVLPEANTDFIFASIAETWGAVAGCLLIIVLFYILKKLINYAMSAKDDFVVYALTGAAALFFGQICFNLTTALHLIINKGMTLPFVSYGGGSFVSFCVLFGMVMALIREDVWDNR